MDGVILAPSFADWQGKAAALELRRQGRELVGSCPSCGGTDRFAVKPVQGGAALIHCRQCKGFVDILKAAGLAEDRPTNGAAPVTRLRISRPERQALSPRLPPAARGRASGSGSDKGHKGQFYPYRVDEAPDWGDRPIVVVEGEKCAERLTRLGYAVVTWCGGTNKVTRTRWGALAGRDAILWPDHDAAGLKAMQQLAEILDGLGCPVRWVSVPEGKPGRMGLRQRDRRGRAPADRRGERKRPCPPYRRDGRAITANLWPRAMTPVEFATADLIRRPRFLLDGVLTANGGKLVRLEAGRRQDDNRPRHSAWRAGAAGRLLP